jgi:hypothetical protein
MAPPSDTEDTEDELAAELAAADADAADAPEVAEKDPDADAMAAEWEAMLGGAD